MSHGWKEDSMLVKRFATSEFREDLHIHKTRMNGLSCGEESMSMFSRFDTIPACDGRTDGRTDGQTSSLYLLRASA